MNPLLADRGEDGVMEAFLHEHLPVYVVSATLVVAAAIDVWKLKAPNLLTFPFVLSGWAYWSAVDGWSGLGFALLGAVVGLALLLGPYAVGGMGAGDVKLLAGVGAWMGASTTFWAFCISALVGGAMALAMIAWRRRSGRSVGYFKAILTEFVYLRDFSLIAEAAAVRKHSMQLLPYGLPLAVGTIIWFLGTGLLP